MTDTIEIVWIANGQPRPFADHERHAVVTWRRDGLIPDPAGRNEFFLELTEDRVRQITAPIMGGIPKQGDPTLVAFRPVGATPDMAARVCHPPAKPMTWQPKQASRWEVHFRIPYCD